MDNKHNLFHYSAFGLSIKSEIEFPVFKPSTLKSIDLSIEYGDVSDSLVNATHTGPNFAYANEEYLVSIKGVALFSITKHTIRVKPCSSKPNMNELRLFLCGSVIGAFLTLHGKTVLHASAVEKNGEAILLVGISGAGKSTLAHSLSKNGYKIITDDLSQISLDENNHPIVSSSYPSQKLWRQTLKIFGERFDEKNRVRPVIDKFLFKDPDRFSDGTFKIRKIFFLSAQNIQSTTFETIEGIQKIRLIKNNLYNKKLIEAFPAEPERFHAFSNIAKHCEFYKIQRPYYGNSIDQIAHCVDKGFIHI